MSEGGSSGVFMASNVTKETVISGWNGLDGSNGPGGQIQCLDFVMGALTGAHWVQNNSLIRSVLA